MKRASMVFVSALFLMTCGPGVKLQNTTLNKSAAPNSSSAVIGSIAITSPSYANKVAGWSVTLSGTCFPAGYAVTLSGHASGSATCGNDGTWSIAADLSTLGAGTGSRTLTVSLTTDGGTVSDSKVVNKVSAECDSAVARANAPFAAGAGTGGNPYKICTPTQLATAGGNVYKGDFLTLCNDIDMDGQAYSPLGSGGADWYFRTFEGQSFIISNLTISAPATTPVGFIGMLGAGGTIQNVRFVNASIEGDEQVGVAVGYAAAANIVNVSATGIVVGNGNSVGGLVGYMSAASADITRGFANVSVTGLGLYTGGLLGYLNDGIVENSYALGDVDGTDRVGGLIGYLNDAVTNSYSVGVPSGTTNVGGLIGDNQGAGVVTDSFWDVTTSGLGTDGGAGSSDGGTGKSTTNMQDSTTFSGAGWDYGTPVWTQSSGAYPRLDWEE